MRRTDKEVTDPAKIKAVIDACTCCRLGFNDNGKVYIVPVSFGYEECGGKYVFYIHGAAEGRKFNLIKAGCEVGFEMDTHYQLKTADTACKHTAFFQSVIGTGKISLIEDLPQKVRALQSVMAHTAGNGDWEFPEEMLARTAAFRLEAEELTCKERA
jgi:hypothetical protein